MTKDGEAVGALILFAEFEAYLETHEILQNKGLLKDLQEALKDEKHGRLWKRNSKGHWISVK